MQFIKQIFDIDKLFKAAAAPSNPGQARPALVFTDLGFLL
jgi:hypothetical protein